jgi:hypothetical protein
MIIPQHTVQMKHKYVSFKLVQNMRLFKTNNFYKGQFKGRAIGQVVSSWLPTAAAQVRARVWQVGFVVDKVVLGKVFSECFDFPCQSLFHQILHHHNHPGHVQQAIQ